jgi:hypothetical protein
LKFAQDNVVYIPDEDDDCLDEEPPGENDDYGYGWDDPPSYDVQPDNEVIYLINSLFTATTLFSHLFSPSRLMLLALLPRLNPCSIHRLVRGLSSLLPQPRALCRCL